MRGFVTIATGKKHYYKIAANLLTSYRYYSKNPMPFAIIAEEENEYTALFDDVIINEETTRSWLDKFDMLKLCPYEETIFIDADCLVFADLNRLWEIFDGATDFSASGRDYAADDCHNAWYNVEDMGEYGKDLPYKCRVHAGMIFMRKGAALDKVYQDCKELYKNYDKLHFHTNAGCIDECVFSLAMPRNGMKTRAGGRVDLLAYCPVLEKVKVNVWEGTVTSFCEGQRIDTGLIVHYSTHLTKKPAYRFHIESIKLLAKYQGEKDKIPCFQKLLYKYRWRYFFLKIEDKLKTFFGGIGKFFKRAFGKIKRTLCKKKQTT